MRMTKWGLAALLSILVWFGTHASAQYCSAIQSVQQSAANATVNAQAGGHIYKHIYGVQVQGLQNYDQGGRTLFANNAQYLAVWNAYVNAGNHLQAICPNNANNNQRVAVTVNVNNFLPDAIISRECTGIDNLGRCNQYNNFVPAEITFVFKYVNNQWILLTAFPRRP